MGERGDIYNIFSNKHFKKRTAFKSINSTQIPTPIPYLIVLANNILFWKYVFLSLQSHDTGTK